MYVQFLYDMYTLYHLLEEVICAHDVSVYAKDLCNLSYYNDTVSLFTTNVSTW